MCGRFVQKSERKVITEEFYIKKFADDMLISYNIAPGQKVGVIIRENDVNVYKRFAWGLVPSWAKEPSIGNRMINARAETIMAKPSFRAAFRSKRCLVPADGFYEWKKLDNRKVPFYIYHEDEKPFSMAGLWDMWEKPDGSPLYTFTIITTDASSRVKDIHSRMPVIIPREEREMWLKEKDYRTLSTLLVPYSGNLLFYEVSRYVNSPGNNSPECIQKIRNHHD